MAGPLSGMVAVVTGTSRSLGEAGALRKAAPVATTNQRARWQRWLRQARRVVPATAWHERSARKVISAVLVPVIEGRHLVISRDFRPLFRSSATGTGSSSQNLSL